METASESPEPLADDLALPAFDELDSVVVPFPGRAAARGRSGIWSRRSPAARQELLWIAVMYVAAHGALLVVAYLNGAYGGHNFLHELANWDGLWYRELANHGYPDHVSYAQTTLGFFPLFPLAIWVVKQPLLLLTAHNAIWCATVAGALISGVGGLVATVGIHRVAERWWDRDTARRATILFTVFPGAIVFSMVYSEGLLLPLSIWCIYLLDRRRWLSAGVLAGLGSAVQPAGIVLPVVCAAAALLELRRCGWRLRRARRSLLAPVLSVTGAGGFALFLWAWTGSPFANYIAQHHGWSEKTDPLAIWHMTTTLAGEVSFTHFNEPTINANLVVGLVGTFALVVMLVLVCFSRRQISVPALVWTAAISFLALTSEYVPPNPRMLLTAFPLLLAVARYARGRWFRVIVWANAALLLGLSVMTFYGTTLRP